MSTLLSLQQVAGSVSESALTGIQALATEGKDNPRADFSDTPWWLSLVKALIIFVYLLVSTLLVIWFERRVIGRMQQRPGPNRNGPFGLLQTLADGNRIVNRSTASVYRDSEGRTRREQTLRSIAAFTSGVDPNMTVFINDPVVEAARAPAGSSSSAATRASARHA